MAYNWAQLGFVERWRMNSVRGQIIGLYRPEDRTLFDLRLRPGEGNVGPISGTIEVRLIDAGDIVREKRIGLLDRSPIIVRIVASSVGASDGPIALSAGGDAGGQRRRLQSGSVARGRVVEVEGTTALVDAGMPLVVELPEASFELQHGKTIELTIAETPKGFFVI